MFYILNWLVTKLSVDTVCLSLSLSPLFHCLYAVVATRGTFALNSVHRMWSYIVNVRVHGKCDLNGEKWKDILHSRTLTHIHARTMKRQQSAPTMETIQSTLVSFSFFPVFFFYYISILRSFDSRCQSNWNLLHLLSYLHSLSGFENANT